MSDQNATDGVIVKQAEFVASATDVRALPPPVFAEVAFAGKSNVGNPKANTCCRGCITPCRS